jgi:hypothetical protein
MDADPSEIEELIEKLDRLAESGCDINTLAAILGHSGLRLLTRYVHPTEQHRAAAMERLEERQRAILRRVK